MSDDVIKKKEVHFADGLVQDFPLEDQTAEVVEADQTKNEEKNLLQFAVLPVRSVTPPREKVFDLARHEDKLATLSIGVGLGALLYVVAEARAGTIDLTSILCGGAVGATSVIAGYLNSNSPRPCSKLVRRSAAAVGCIVSIVSGITLSGIDSHRMFPPKEVFISFAGVSLVVCGINYIIHRYRFTPKEV